MDTFLDMGRSATNAVGNSIATAVVAKWEGELLPEPRPPPTRRGWMKNSSQPGASRARLSRAQETAMASRTAWKPLLALCVASALLAGPAGAQESGASSLPDAARVTFTL